MLLPLLPKTNSSGNPAGIPQVQTEAATTAGLQSASVKTAGFAPGIPAFSSSASLLQLASSLGLPQDNLTFMFLTFSRVFSLPLENISDLRKEILAFVPSSPKTDRDKARAEAFSLAAAAAEAKGLKLSQEALAEYVNAMGDFSEGSGKEGAEGQNENQRRGDSEGLQNLAQAPNAAELEESFEKFSESDGLLGLMNRIPDKNGKNWVVWPFKISVGGTELRVFVRLLIEEPFSLTGPGLLMADITGPKRHWRFFLEKSPKGKFRVRIGLSPGLEPEGLKALEREAAKALGSFLAPAADLQVLNGEIMLAGFMDCKVPSINEAV